jgi:LacI family transcriptional regulator
MPRRATIKDVAALAGVSLKTVSRVINREPGVSVALIARVERAVGQLDYRHNLAASNLRRGQRTQSIGVLLHDHANAFSANVLRAIEDRARSVGVAVLSASLDDESEREAAMATDLVSRRVDGLIVMPTSADQSYLLSEIRAGLSVVAVDRPAQGVHVDTVVVDNVAGTRVAMTHLLARGHVTIACLTDRQTIWTARQRLQGYRQALDAAGIEYDDRLVVPDLTSDATAKDAVLRLLDLPHPPTAIFAGRNNLAVGSVRALRERDLARRVALVSFDDFPMADLLEPAVTVIRQDLRALGAKAADLLFARMGGSAAAPELVQLTTTQVERGSGEINPSGVTPTR